MEMSNSNAKLREALMEVKRTLQYLYRLELSPCDGDNKRIADAIGIIDAALSAPARNCDLYPTHFVALNAWRDLDPRMTGAFDMWLFAEVEGGAE